jgi:hypothetical protein
LPGAGIDTRPAGAVYAGLHPVAVPGVLAIRILIASHALIPRLVADLPGTGIHPDLAHPVGAVLRPVAIHPVVAVGIHPTGGAAVVDLVAGLPIAGIQPRPAGTARAGLRSVAIEPVVAVAGDQALVAAILVLVADPPHHSAGIAQGNAVIHRTADLLAIAIKTVVGTVGVVGGENAVIVHASIVGATHIVVTGAVVQTPLALVGSLVAGQADGGAWVTATPAAGSNTAVLAPVAEPTVVGTRGMVGDVPARPGISCIRRTGVGGTTNPIIAVGVGLALFAIAGRVTEETRRGARITDRIAFVDGRIAVLGPVAEIQVIRAIGVIVGEHAFIRSITRVVRAE